MHRALDSCVEAVPDTDAVGYLERTGLTSLKRLRSLQKSAESYPAVRTDVVLQSNPLPFNAFSASSRIEPSSEDLVAVGAERARTTRFHRFRWKKATLITP
jgi:hypothetical protein